MFAEHQTDHRVVLLEPGLGCYSFRGQRIDSDDLPPGIKFQKLPATICCVLFLFDDPIQRMGEGFPCLIFMFQSVATVDFGTLWDFPLQSG